jgi:hypothetical protein
MKKILLIVSSIFVLTTLLTLIVNLDISNSKMNLTLREDVKAEYGWVLNENVPCPNSEGTYKRCEDVWYSSNCNVHDQTLCEDPE